MQVLKCGSSIEENVGPQVLEELRLQQFDFVHELFGCRYVPKGVFFFRKVFLVRRREMFRLTVF